MKKPNLYGCALKDLPKEIGFNVEIPRTSGNDVGPEWNARVFSHEQIKFAIQDVYTSYLVGDKILSMV